MSKLQSTAVEFSSTYGNVTSGKILLENSKYKIIFSGNIEENRVYSIQVKSINKYYSFLNYRDHIDINNQHSISLLTSELIVKFETENIEHHTQSHHHSMLDTRNYINKLKLTGDMDNSFKTSWGVYDSNTNNIGINFHLNKYDFIKQNNEHLDTNAKIKINNIRMLFFEDVVDSPVTHSSFNLGSNDQIQWTKTEDSKFGSTTGNGEEWWHGFLDAVQVVGIGGSEGKLISNIFNKYANFNENTSSGVQNLITLSLRQQNFSPLSTIYNKAFQFHWNAGATSTSLFGDNSHISIIGAAVDIDCDLTWDSYKE